MGRYRRLGADLPFSDPRRAHGVEMEGYYWRLSDPGSGRVILALCGVCQGPDGPWAAAAAAAHPERLIEQAITPTTTAARDCYSVDAGALLHADERRLSVAVGQIVLEADLDRPIHWPLARYGALGPAHWVPGLGQYWHPHLLDARARGFAQVGGERVSLDGWHVYAEKNWGAGFPGRWWWGQAHGFDRDDVCVAFAGGRLPGAPLSATAMVVRLGTELIRLSPPTALVRADCGPSRWRLTGTSPRYRVELEGHARDPYMLPVPLPAERRTEPRAAQHLDGRVRVTVRRGRRLLWEGESTSAGLEYGDVGQPSA